MPLSDDIRRRILALWVGPPAMSTLAIAAEVGLSKNAVVGIIYRARQAGAPLPKRDQQVRSANAARLRRGRETPAELPVSTPPGRPVSEPHYGSGGAARVGAENPAPHAGEAPAKAAAVPGAAATHLRLVWPVRTRPAPQPRACKWPMWGHGERPTHRYCGAAAVPGWLPYCAEHRAAAIARPRGEGADVA